VTPPVDFAPRRTLRQTVEVGGVGLHTGASVKTTLVPATRPGTGVVFRITGGASGAVKEVAARASNVSDTARCTLLGSGAGTVSTVEHLLSALAGFGVTDLIVEVDGPELPIGDGSALIWTEVLTSAGIVTMEEENGVAPLALVEPVIEVGEKGAFVAAYPSDVPRFTVAAQFDHPLAGTQVARWEPARGEAYAEHVAPARTFGFDFEVEALRAAGLARGGSLDNAVVIYPDRYSSPLRFPDELARHKLLDLVGDLFLVGRPLLADVVAVRPSHRLNVALARRLVSTAAATLRPNGRS